MENIECKWRKKMALKWILFLLADGGHPSNRSIRVGDFFTTLSQLLDLSLRTSTWLRVVMATLYVAKQAHCRELAESRTDTWPQGGMRLHTHLCVCVCVRVFLFVREGQAPQFGCDRLCPVSTSSIHKMSLALFLLHPSSEQGCNRDSTCHLFTSVTGQEGGWGVRGGGSLFVCVGACLYGFSSPDSVGLFIDSQGFPYSDWNVAPQTHFCVQGGPPL